MEAEAATYWLGWVRLVQLVAVFLVAVGVVAEFAGEWIGRPLERKIEAAHDLQIEQLKETADAKLELARLSTPRVKLLTPEAVASLVEKLEAFKGTKFDIGHALIGREQWDFLWQFEPILPKAGWQFVDWIGPRAFVKLNWTMKEHVYGEANVLNVVIELTPEKRAELLPAAEALADVLNKIGIPAEVTGHPMSSISATADAIHILVGEKQ